MDPLKRKAIKGVIILLCILGIINWIMFAGLFRREPSDLTIPDGFLPGILSGLIAGCSGCIYMQKTWDPKLLRPKTDNRETDYGRLATVAVVGGSITARLLGSLHPAFGVFLAMMFFGFSDMMLLFMVTQVIRYHLWPNRDE